MLFDTHCHLTHHPLNSSLASLLSQSNQNNIGYFLVPGTNISDWDDIILLSNQYSFIYMALGIHPWWVQLSKKSIDLQYLKQSLLQYSTSLVGEVGLDFYRARSDFERKQQIELFEDQLCIAKELNRAIVLHNVRAGNECLRSMKRCQFTNGGFAHSFSGSFEEAQQWVQNGFKIGIGTLLLKSQRFQRVVSRLNLIDLVLETDAPYGVDSIELAPSYAQVLPNIAAELAKLQQVSVDIIIETTTQSAHSLLST